MIIDSPSPFSPLSEWREFLEEMEKLALESSSDATLVRDHIKLAKAQLALSLDPPRFKCPKCKQKAGVDIIYGFPSEEAFEQAGRNEAVLAGCMQEIGAPDDSGYLV